MNTSDDHPHMAFTAVESIALSDTAWDQWIARLEKILGFSVDGDEEIDGYSMDGCYEMFKAGKRPLDASHTVLWRKNGLHR